MFRPGPSDLKWMTSAKSDQRLARWLFFGPYSTRRGHVTVVLHTQTGRPAMGDGEALGSTVDPASVVLAPLVIYNQQLDRVLGSMAHVGSRITSWRGRLPNKQ